MINANHIVIVAIIVVMIIAIIIGIIIGIIGDKENGSNPESNSESNSESNPESNSEYINNTQTLPEVSNYNEDTPDNAGSGVLFGIIGDKEND